MRKLIFIIITIAVLAGLWFVLKPPAIQENQAQTAAAKPAADAPAQFVFKLSNGVVSGPGTFEVRQGEAVDIQITSDTPDEAHLHGYDLHAKLQPGIAAHLRFTADKSGRFELELHRKHQTIGALEVYPEP